MLWCVFCLSFCSYSFFFLGSCSCFLSSSSSWYAKQQSLLPQCSSDLFWNARLWWSLVCFVLCSVWPRISSPRWACDAGIEKMVVGECKLCSTSFCASVVAWAGQKDRIIMCLSLFSPHISFIFLFSSSLVLLDGTLILLFLGVALKRHQHHPTHPNPSVLLSMRTCFVGCALETFFSWRLLQSCIQPQSFVSQTFQSLKIMGTYLIRLIQRGGHACMLCNAQRSEKAVLLSFVFVFLKNVLWFVLFLRLNRANALLLLASRAVACPLIRCFLLFTMNHWWRRSLTLQIRNEEEEEENTFIMKFGFCFWVSHFFFLRFWTNSFSARIPMRQFPWKPRPTVPTAPNLPEIRITIKIFQTPLLPLSLLTGKIVTTSPALALMIWSPWSCTVYNNLYDCDGELLTAAADTTVMEFFCPGLGCSGSGSVWNEWFTKLISISRVRVLLLLLRTLRIINKIKITRTINAKTARTIKRIWSVVSGGLLVVWPPTVMKLTGKLVLPEPTWKEEKKEVKT